MNSLKTKARLGTVKRLLELARALPDFEESLESNLQGWNLDLSAVEAKAILEGNSPLLVDFQEREKEKTRHRLSLRQECVPLHPGLQAWRSRQEARCLSELGGHRHQVILHYPAAFELTSGCSVGCWFCGFAAPPLTGKFGATDSNLALWREVLVALRERVGPGARRAFGYWATDPLDHPDYEVFCRQFYDVLGGWPRTTTALGARDVERTRALLSESRERGCRTDRLSVLSKGDLKRLYQAFQPDELLDVELIIHLTGSHLLRSTSGRARARVEQGKRVARDFPSAAEEAGTIACVSGFLVEMPRRRVRLISPCRATDERPLGYRVVAEASFQSGEEFGQALEELTSPDKLEIAPADDRILRFRSDLALEPRGVKSAYRLHQIRAGQSSTSEPLDLEPCSLSPASYLGGESSQALQLLLHRLANGGISMIEAIGILHLMHEQSPRVTASRLAELWGLGLLEE